MLNEAEKLGPNTWPSAVAAASTAAPHTRVFRWVLGLMIESFGRFFIEKPTGLRTWGNETAKTAEAREGWVYTGSSSSNLQLPNDLSFHLLLKSNPPLPPQPRPAGERFFALFLNRTLGLR
jgi:hypothetical protein